jgi:hypothetical protein
LSRPPLLLALVVLAGVPGPVLAQTWPATAVAAAGAIGPASRTFALNDRASPLRMWAAPAAARKPMVLQLRTRAASDSTDTPTVDVRAKDGWSDDQGFRLSPTRLAFKRRF